ncbi:hypothetical protein NQ317_001168 [Molorchus minor]|uniref:Protein kinase domain-containing protein n=1 Tax=Molorchus minor TaxID=1323400 RepID=A0ABQ9JVF1_9CUCU|nr:hypothetical protein NQ317_001168 [Molorchus minor]
MLDCVVEGDPKPKVHWDKNLKMNDFDLTRFRVLPNGTLLISEVHKEMKIHMDVLRAAVPVLTKGSSAYSALLVSRDGFHTEADGDSTVTKAVLITMSVAGAYIVLVIGLMVWCRYRGERSRKLPIGDVAKTENGDVEHTELKDGNNGGSAGPSKCKVNGLETHKEGQRVTVQKQPIPRLLISQKSRGEFGDIMVANISKSVLTPDKRSSQTLSDPPPEDKEVPVLVKGLSQTKDENCLSEFKRELDMFTKISHENITKLYGLCREAEPHYLILEYTDWLIVDFITVVILKNSFWQHKAKNTPPLTSVQSVAILHQLSRGMDHLANNRMVHKDLAARNCLVSSTLIAKVSLPRLTRDPYSQEYCKHVNQIIPLRWLPYEAVYEDEYSTKSDMYSFGVLIWEIFAQGELPQSKINDTSFLNKLKEKQLEWKVHPSTPEALTKIQESCWDIDPKKRPTFSEVSKELGEILKSM